MPKKEKNHKADIGSSEAFDLDSFEALIDAFLKMIQHEIVELKEQQSSEQQRTQSTTGALFSAAIQALNESQREQIKKSTLEVLKLHADNDGIKDRKADLGSLEGFLDSFLKKKQQEIDELKEQQGSEQRNTQSTADAFLIAAIQALGENQIEEIKKMSLEVPKFLVKQIVFNIENNSKKLAFSMKKKVKIQKQRCFLEENESGDDDEDSPDSNSSSSPDSDLSLNDVLFYSPSFDNIQGLNTRMRELIFRGKEINGLEARMAAVLVKSEEIELKFKRKKSFFEWLMEIDRSDNEWDILNALKAVAANNGIKLTHLLLDFMLVASDSKTMNKLRVLKSALKWVIQGQKSVVIQRVLAVLDWIDSDTEFEELEEDVADKTILLFLNIILKMEFFWMHGGLPCEKSSISGEYRKMENELDKCLSGLTAIESDIRSMKKLSAFDLEEEDQDLKRKGKFLNTDEMWDHIEDSEF